MRETFREYYPLSREEHKLIWNKAIIVFDTNVLLNFYRYSPNTFQTFSKILNMLSNKIWIPFQVAEEVHAYRLSVIDNQIKIYYEYRKKLDKLQKDFENEIKSPFISKLLLSETKDGFNKIKEELLVKEQFFKNLIQNDNILDTISNIFDKKIGRPLSKQEFQTILIKEGEKRFDNKSLALFMNDNSTSSDRYNDLMLWFQLINKAQSDKCPILFITDDIKNNWWIQSESKTFSPDYNLLREFYNMTGELFYMYRAFNFLEYAKTLIKDGIDESVMNEVKQFSSNEQMVYIEIKNDKSKDLNQLLEMITNDGYDIFQQNSKNDIVFLQIILPNINDIFEIFSSKLKTYSSLTNIEILHVSSVISRSIEE